MKKMFSGGLLIAFLLCFGGAIAEAQSASDSYQINESFIGPGGALESNSANYGTAPGQQSVGNTSVGESNSNSFRSQSGSETTDDPSLSCTVNTANVNFGSLSTSVPATATATFSVLNYTAYGYVVQMVGSPPSTGSHTLANMSSNAASTPGTEQFGMNLVANTAPTIFGADPEQVPDSSFSSGAAAANYNTPNSFRYVPGETIAYAAESSGLTDYTISYLVNTAVTTAGGSYSGEQTLVCVGTY